MLLEWILKDYKTGWYDRLNILYTLKKLYGAEAAEQRLDRIIWPTTWSGLDID